MQQAAWIAVALYLLAMPLVSASIAGWNGHDLARAAQLPLGLACAAAWVLNPGAMPRATAWGAGGALLLAGGSTLAADVPAMALRELALVAGLAAVVAAVAAGPRPPWRWAWVPVAALALYGAVLLLITVVVVAAGGTPSRVDLFVGYVNHRFFSHVLTAAMPLLLVVTQAPAASPRLRRAALATLVVCAALMFATAGRGTMLALAAAAVFVGVLVGRRALPALRTLAGATAAGALLFGLLFVAGPWLVQGAPAPLDDYGSARLSSDQARVYLWGEAWQQIRGSPWLGLGPMHYAHVPNAKAAHPHNLTLQLAAEWGLPLCLLALAAAAWGLARLLGRLRTAGLDAGAAAVGVPLAIGCIAVLLDAQVSGNLVMPVSQVWSAVLVGSTLAWWRAAGPRATPPRVPTRWLAGLALLAQVWLVLAVWPEVTDLARHLQQVQAAFPTERLQPRFWSVGRF
jgi:hypothetical protein